MTLNCIANGWVSCSQELSLSSYNYFPTIQSLNSRIVAQLKKRGSLILWVRSGVPISTIPLMKRIQTSSQSIGHLCMCYNTLNYCTVLGQATWLPLSTTPVLYLANNLLTFLTITYQHYNFSTQEPIPDSQHCFYLLKNVPFLCCMIHVEETRICGLWAEKWERCAWAESEVVGELKDWHSERGSLGTLFVNQYIHVSSKTLVLFYSPTTHVHV